MPFTVDICGLTAELFGAAVTLCGEIITVDKKILVSKFYQGDLSEGWMHYVQSASEDTFEAYINNNFATPLITAFEDAVNKTAGATYNLAHKGLKNLDVSGTSLGWGPVGPYAQFHSLQDFVLSYLANAIFGHPGALAPIKNDSALRAAIGSKFSAGLEALRGATGVSLDLNQTAIDAVNADASGAVLAIAGVATAAVTANLGVPRGIDSSGAIAVVQQMMNLDPARFSEDNKGKLVALHFESGDKIDLQIRLHSNSYKLFGTQLVDASTAAEDTVIPASAMLGATNAGTELGAEWNKYYVLRFTLL
jgi:hypothetical protein